MNIEELIEMDMGSAVEWLIENKDRFELIPKNALRESSRRLSEGHNYLMACEPDEVEICDALEAFGFGRDGAKE